MTDREFLWWIHERLVHRYGEHEMYDYMHHLRAIIKDTHKHQETPNIARTDTDPSDMREELG